MSRTPFERLRDALHDELALAPPSEQEFSQALMRARIHADLRTAVISPAQVIMLKEVYALVAEKERGLKRGHERPSR